MWDNLCTARALLSKDGFRVRDLAALGDGVPRRQCRPNPRRSTSIAKLFYSNGRRMSALGRNSFIGWSRRRSPRTRDAGLLAIAAYRIAQAVVHRLGI